MDPITIRDVMILRINKLNRNNRIYDIAAVNKIIEDYLYYTDNSMPLMGQIGYPDDFSIPLNNVSHSLIGLRIVNDYLLGDIKILDTPAGKILADNLKSYVFRTRSSGTLGDGNIVIVSQFYGVDAVPLDQDPYAI